MNKVELITKDLGTHLIKQMDIASSIYILTSFVMKSGIEYLKKPLKRAAERGADIKICSGDYLYITQPDALEELLSIDESIQIRLWKSNGKSFHPKAYHFQTNDQECLFIGSSNLSKSALTQGVEWNLSVSYEKDVFADALEHFISLFLSEQTVALNDESLKEYRERYSLYHRKNPIVEEWTSKDELDLMLPSSEDKPLYQDTVHDPSATYGEIKPRRAQLEALEELDKTLEEDYKKALVVMATGLGKTYLAGFFAERF